MRDRGRTPQSVERQWRTQVLPMHRQHVDPVREHVDLVAGADQGLGVASHPRIAFVVGVHDHADAQGSDGVAHADGEVWRLATS